MSLFETSLSPSVEVLANSLNTQQQFLLFMKVLFVYLRGIDGDENKRMLKQVKTIVSTCTFRNRLQDPAYTPLMDSVERRLRKFLGQGHWDAVKLRFLDFCTRRGIYPMLPFATFTS